MKPSEMSAADCVRNWVDGTFTLRSGFYSGRGVNAGDLNDRILEMFYQGLKKDFGDDSAANFVRFVNKLNDLSASAFIVAFERFWAHDCTVIDIAQERSDRVQLSAHGDALFAEALGAIAGILSGGDKLSDEQVRAESFSIKLAFILRHAKEVPAEEMVHTSKAHRGSQYYPSGW